MGARGALTSPLNGGEADLGGGAGMTGGTLRARDAVAGHLGLTLLTVVSHGRTGVGR